MSIKRIKAGVLCVAVVTVLGVLHARQPVQHLPLVDEYGAVLAYNVALDGDDACVGTTTGINDPTRPTLVGAVSWAGAAGRVCVRGQTAYVSRGEGGVRIVDVSQSTAPTVVGEVAIEGRGGLIALVSGHLAIATERGVCLYDISAPRAPVLRKLLPGRLSDIYSDGDRTLFVHSSGVMTVLDLSSIDSPRVLGTIGAYFHDLARRGDLVFGVMTGLKVYRLVSH